MERVLRGGKWRDLDTNVPAKPTGMLERKLVS